MQDHGRQSFRREWRRRSRSPPRRHQYHHRDHYECSNNYRRGYWKKRDADCFRPTLRQGHEHRAFNFPRASPSFTSTSPARRAYYPRCSGENEDRRRPRRKMSPAQAQDAVEEKSPPHVGPHPSFIQIAQPYIFEHKLRGCMSLTRVNEAKEDSIRLQGVAWIDSVRKALKLPVRTFNTAAVYYHRFRLVHADNEYSYIDAAAAALFTACKIEDTLKRSKEILCAAYNLKLSTSDHVSQDDAMFENPSKAIVGLERLMLEASAFDFRSHNPQKLLLKVAKNYRADPKSVGKDAYNMSLDLYRTYAPLKQTTPTMALACVELAGYLHEQPIEDLAKGAELERWRTTRAEVMETLLDLLDLYTHHRQATTVGQDHSIEEFIAIRLKLNQEAKLNNISRYDPPPKKPSDQQQKTRPRNVVNGAQKGMNGSTKDMRNPSNSPLSPIEIGVNGNTNESTPTRQRAGMRDGTVRFMLDREKVEEETKAVDEFWKVEEEEIEIEVEVKSERRR